MNDTMRIIPTSDIIYVLESHLSTSEVAGILLELLEYELRVKTDSLEILEKGYTVDTSLINLKEIPNACKNCSNHPSNGGSGICNCILGLSQIYY